MNADGAWGERMAAMEDARLKAAAWAEALAALSDAAPAAARDQALPAVSDPAPAAALPAVPDPAPAAAPAAPARLPTGTLMAHGILFLRSGVYRQLDAAGDTQYILPMVQRDGRGVMLVSGIWSGAAADSFYRLCGPMGSNVLRADRKSVV